jgi:hypothetical protein
MTKAYIGESFDVTDSAVQVTKALLTKSHLSLEWKEGQYVGGLSASSADGIVYEGTFIYHGWPGEVFHARLGRYDGANGGILLFGEWWNEDPSAKTTWLIQLVPAAA